MTEHQRNVIPAEEVPALEMPSPSNQEEAAPAQPITELDPAWDISRLATRGHVLTERAFVITRDLLFPVLFLGLIAGMLLLQAIIGVFTSAFPLGSAFDSYVMNAIFSGFVLAIFVAAAFRTVTGASMGSIELNVTALVLLAAVFSLVGVFLGEHLPSVRVVLLFLGLLGGAGFILYGFWRGVSNREHNRLLIWATSALLVANVASGVGSFLSSQNAGIIPFARHFLTFNPSSYFDLGGGLRGGPQFAWMSAYGPKPESLTVAQYAALTKAVTADIRAHGLDVQAWTATAELTPAPTITRAAKVINQYAGNLKSGVIIIPEGYGALSIVAHVEGQWSVTQFGGGGACATVFGPASDESGCQKQTAIQAGEGGDAPFNRYASEVLRSIRPHTTEE